MTEAGSADPAREEIGGGRDIPLDDERGVPASAVARTIAAAFNVEVARWTRVPAGERSTGMRVSAEDGREWFAKLTATDTGVHAQHEGTADQVDRAGDAGIPVARLRRTDGGVSLAPVVGADVAAVVSLAPWIDGEPMTAPVPISRVRVAGESLGRIHRAVEGATERGLVTAADDPWLRFDAAALDAKVARAEALVRAHLDDPGDAPKHSVAFDRTALADLAERRTWFDDVRRALESMPALENACGHGDYAVPNLLYTGGATGGGTGNDLAAVLDFAPPRAIPLAIEVGRMAFAPELLSDGTWEDRSRAFLESYVAARPETRDEDVAAAPRAAFVQLVRSMYPAQALHEGRARHPADLVGFWAKRQVAARRLGEALREGVFG